MCLVVEEPDALDPIPRPVCPFRIRLVASVSGKSGAETEEQAVGKSLPSPKLAKWWLQPRPELPATDAEAKSSPSLCSYPRLAKGTCHLKPPPQDSVSNRATSLLNTSSTIGTPRQLGTGWGIGEPSPGSSHGCRRPEALIVIADDVTSQLRGMKLLTGPRCHMSACINCSCRVFDIGHVRDWPAGSQDSQADVYGFASWHTAVVT
ncbi:hypothetical protein J3459_018171 [Metarhizium acridum]|nr:hypothetical protein J3459_018171 [Metarhizium acridum]